MDIGMYIDDEEKREKRRLLLAGRVIIWVIMIGVSIFLASQSLIISG